MGPETNEDQRECDHVDRAGWTPGPWDQEKDRYEWHDGDLPCLIVRSPATGSLCGYVGVPPGHPWHGRDYDDMDEVEVHGGLTYSEACLPVTSGPGEVEDAWWVGFDCAHSHDVTPRLDSRQPLYAARLMRVAGGRVYRDVAYVRAQVALLAMQARAATGGT